MGKRELLLIGAFALVGLILWKATAPPGEPGARGFSLQQVIDNIRSGLQSHDTEADVKTSVVAETPAAVTRLEVDEFTGSVAIEATDAGELVADLRGVVFGPDEAGAQAFAAATVLRTTRDGEVVRLSFERPEMRHLPRLELTLKVPRRLAVEIAMQRGRLEAAGVAGLEYEARRTTVVVRDVPGTVKGNQSFGEVEIADVGTLDLSARRAEVRVERVRGAIKGEADGGDWLVRDVTGTVTMESERADLSLERLGGDLEFEGSDGSLTVRDDVGNMKAEGRRCRLTIRVGGAGTIDVTTEDAPVEVQIDASVGARYDIRTEDAEVRAPEGALRIDTREQVTEATGTVGPGGRFVKVRSRRGDVTVRP